MEFEMNVNISEEAKKEILGNTEFMNKILKVIKKNYSQLLTDLEEIEVDTDRFYIQMKMKYDDYANGFTLEV